MAETGERKAALEMVQADGTDGNCVTFVLHDEDHTLGNSLRYMVMKNPDVEFCGYCITHPSESKINFRIQTRGSLPAVEPFRKGLNDLMGVCQHVLDTFEVRLLPEELRGLLGQEGLRTFVTKSLVAFSGILCLILV
ncbi:DNA-directed RNA polymerases I and III subunit RPAC2-like isoform X1 [Lagopus muta]|uniref:DNA-directed RNA polymerases I and III subunit RPAC2-like isoform X1 n=1 Tax=Lagopus muta TaxID=64668 RepID=UPI0020A070C5|nr:DNA-directed RNA polymerases I and III subunit RPAC2-like isoform X1 [Lagopus muta]